MVVAADRLVIDAGAAQAAWRALRESLLASNVAGDIAELCDVMVRLLAHAARPDMDLVRIILEDEAAAAKICELLARLWAHGDVASRCSDIVGEFARSLRPPSTEDNALGAACLRSFGPTLMGFLGKAPHHQNYLAARRVVELIVDILDCGASLVLALKSSVSNAALRNCASALPTFQDYALQTGTLELLFRLSPAQADKKRAFALDVFTKRELASEFCLLRSRQFEADARVFLNRLNSRSPVQGGRPLSVVALKAHGIAFNGVALKPPAGASFFWLDVNAKSLSFDATLPGEQEHDFVEIPYAQVLRYSFLSAGSTKDEALQVQLATGWRAATAIRAPAKTHPTIQVDFASKQPSTDSWKILLTTVLRERQGVKVSETTSVAVVRRRPESPTALTLRVDNDSQASRDASRAFAEFETYKSSFTRPVEAAVRPVPPGILTPVSPAPLRSKAPVDPFALDDADENAARPNRNPTPAKPAPAADPFELVDDEAPPPSRSSRRKSVPVKKRATPKQATPEPAPVARQSPRRASPVPEELVAATVVPAAAADEDDYASQGEASRASMAPSAAAEDADADAKSSASTAGDNDDDDENDDDDGFEDLLAKMHSILSSQTKQTPRAEAPAFRSSIESQFVTPAVKPFDDLEPSSRLKDSGYASVNDKSRKRSHEAADGESFEPRTPLRRRLFDEQSRGGNADPDTIDSDIVSAWRDIGGIMNRDFDDSLARVMTLSATRADAMFSHASRVIKHGQENAVRSRIQGALSDISNQRSELHSKIKEAVRTGHVAFNKRLDNCVAARRAQFDAVQQLAPVLSSMCRSYVDHVASYKQGISREIAALRH